METRNKIAAVTFDAAGTILTPAPSVGHVYTRIARRYGVNADPVALEEAFHFTFQTATRRADRPAPFDRPDVEQYVWWRDVVHAAFHHVGALISFGDGFEAYFDELFEYFARPDAWRIYDDVLPTLEWLRERHVPLAVISNWDNRLHRLIKRTPLAPFMDFVLTSADAGSMKPSPRIYSEAARRLGVAPGMILHVGDSAREDVEGARAAGLHACHIDRSSTRQSPDAVNTLLALPERLVKFL